MLNELLWALILFIESSISAMHSGNLDAKIDLFRSEHNIFSVILRMEDALDTFTIPTLAS